jgi:hypothetical protein
LREKVPGGRMRVLFRHAPSPQPLSRERERG